MEHWQRRNAVWVESDLGVAIRMFERIAVSADGSRRRVSSETVLAKDETSQSEVWLHLVNPDGTTRFEVPELPAMNTRLARRDAIPAARIEHLTDAQLARLGYV